MKNTAAGIAGYARVTSEKNGRSPGKKRYVGRGGVPARRLRDVLRFEVKRAESAREARQAAENLAERRVENAQA